MSETSILSAVLVGAGLLGLVIGAFLRIVVRRASAGRPAPTSARFPLIEVATAIAFVGVVGLSADIDGFGLASPAEQPAAWVVVTIAYLSLAAISIALTLIDLDTHRLPNAIVVPGYAVLSVLFVAACMLGVPWAALLRAVVSGVALGAFYWLLRAIRTAGMGGGDVKLAGVLGMALGFVGWGAAIVGAFAAFLLGGVVGVALLLTRRASRTTAIAFGPFMLVGAWGGILAGESVARWYGGVLG